MILLQEDTSEIEALHASIRRELVFALDANEFIGVPRVI